LEYLYDDDYILEYIIQFYFALLLKIVKYSYLQAKFESNL